MWWLCRGGVQASTLPQGEGVGVQARHRTKHRAKESGVRNGMDLSGMGSELDTVDSAIATADSSGGEAPDAAGAGATKAGVETALEEYEYEMEEEGVYSYWSEHVDMWDDTEQVEGGKHMWCGSAGGAVEQDREGATIAMFVEGLNATVTEDTLDSQVRRVCAREGPGWGVRAPRSVDVATTE